MHTLPLTTVYVLRSRIDPARHYVGTTSHLRSRLVAHNSGEVASTARSAPWTLIAAFRFPEEKTALAFERYLKSGSGRAFAKRHFDPDIDWG